MLYQRLLLALTLGVRSTYADVQSIVTAIDAIAESATILESTVLAWSGKFFDAFALDIQNHIMYKLIKNDTVTARAEDDLTYGDALAVKTSSEQMVANINSTLDTFIDYRPKFDKAMLCPRMLMYLSQQKKAAAAFADAVVTISPGFGKVIADVLGRQVDDPYGKAVDVYMKPKKGKSFSS